MNGWPFDQLRANGGVNLLTDFAQALRTDGPGVVVTVQTEGIQAAGGSQTPRKMKTVPFVSFTLGGGANMGADGVFWSLFVLSWVTFVPLCAIVVSFCVILCRR